MTSCKGIGVSDYVSICRDKSCHMLSMFIVRSICAALLSFSERRSNGRAFRDMSLESKDPERCPVHFSNDCLLLILDYFLLPVIYISTSWPCGPRRLQFLSLRVMLKDAHNTSLLSPVKMHSTLPLPASPTPCFRLQHPIPGSYTSSPDPCSHCQAQPLYHPRWCI